MRMPVWWAQVSAGFRSSGEASNIRRNSSAVKTRSLTLRPAGHGGLELHNGPSRDLSMRQGTTRVVDLVQRVASGYQSVQRQPTLPEPAD